MMSMTSIKPLLEKTVSMLGEEFVAERARTSTRPAKALRRV